MVTSLAFKHADEISEFSCLEEHDHFDMSLIENRIKRESHDNDDVPTIDLTTLNNEIRAEEELRNVKPP